MSTSASKTSAPVTTETTTIDRRVAADNGAIVLGDGSKLETMSDDVAMQAISAALATTQTGAVLADSLTGKALEFAKTASGQSYKSVTEALDAVRENNASASATQETALALVAKNASPGSANTEMAMKLAAGVAVAAIVGGAVMMAARKAK